MQRFNSIVINAGRQSQKLIRKDCLTSRPANLLNTLLFNSFWNTSCESRLQINWTTISDFTIMKNDENVCYYIFKT